MKTKMLTIFLLLFLCSSSFGFEKLMPLPEKIKASDLIAHVEIISVQKIEKPTGYSSIARVKIIEGIKGTTTGLMIDLEFDTGLSSPNVVYSQGDKCILFAKKMRNSHYQTINTRFGKIDINNLHLSSGEHVEFIQGYTFGRDIGPDSYLTLEEALQEIREHIKNK